MNRLCVGFPRPRLSCREVVAREDMIGSILQRDRDKLSLFGLVQHKRVL